MAKINIVDRLKTIEGKEGSIFSILAEYDDESIVKNFYYININNHVIKTDNTDVYSRVLAFSIYGLFANNLLTLTSFGEIVSYAKNDRFVGKFYIDQYNLRLQIINFTFIFHNKTYRLLNPTSFIVDIIKVNPCKERDQEFTNIAQITSEFNAFVKCEEKFFNLFSVGLIGTMIPYSRFFETEDRVTPIVLQDSNFCINVHKVNEQHTVKQ